MKKLSIICLLLFLLSGKNMWAIDTLRLPDNFGDTTIQEVLSEDEQSLVSGDSLTKTYKRLGVFRPYKFFSMSPEKNKARIGTISGSIGGIYAVSNIWWSKAWYSQYDRGGFRFFNDAKEWNQMDKGGHVFNAYFLSRWGAGMYEWAGVKPNTSAWLGFMFANLWQLSIELQDGFSPKWGFSWTDIAANMSGSLLFLGQHYLWKEQRINVKISAFPVNYPEALQDRAEELYGTSISELILKDYNAMTFWLSVSPGSFIRKPTSKFPKWIAVSFGYGARNLYGGFSNKWCGDGSEDTEDCVDIIDISDEYKRTRQYYLSFDIDWTKIPVKNNGVKFLFQILNIVKIPFPAVEFNQPGNVRWKWLKF